MEKFDLTAFGEGEGKQRGTAIEENKQKTQLGT